MTGGGNDFVLFDNRKKNLPADYSELARKLCDRKFSIGGDGLLILEADPSADFRMVYFNSDGSRAEMCGNGARCIARFAQMVKAASGKMNFQTDAGPVSAEVHDRIVKVNLGPPRDLRLDFSIKLEEQKEVNASFVNTGVPHAVILVSDLEKIDVADLGRKARYHKEFSPEGTNANFVRHVDEHNLIVRTYERGVEGETLACGTGATASAVVFGAKGMVSSPVSCLTKGGEVLKVYFKIETVSQGISVTEVSLEGPAEICFHGEVEL